MAVKTFTTGEVLTAADTNTYLNNGGLVYIKSQTIGSGVTSVTVSDAFSATYDNYEIILGGGQSSLGASWVLTFGSANTEYYGSYYYDLYTGANTGTLRRSNGANMYVGTSAGTTDGRQQIRMTVTSPNKTERTTVSGMNYGAGFAGWFAGEQFSATAFTAFTLAVTAGTATGGTITVYGYRKA